MTENLIFKIQDSLSVVREALKKALILHEEIELDFFVKAANQGADAMMIELPRCKVFSTLLGDVLNEIGANLPSNEWLEEQKEKCGNE